MIRVLPAVAVLAFLAAPQSHCEPQAARPGSAAPRVDLQRYLGTWYELASIPQSYARGCVATSATYSLAGDGELEVVTRCRKGSFDGSESVAYGKARLESAATAAKLRLSFLWPFWGDYWILELDPQYRFAAVGTADHQSLWILSRTRALDAPTYEALVTRLRAQGFDVARLQRTAQPAG